MTTQLALDWGDEIQNADVEESKPRSAPTELIHAGAAYISGFLSDSEAADALDWIDSLPGDVWITELSRRVIHYGWRYDYRARRISTDMYLGKLPAEMARLAAKLHNEVDAFDKEPNQVIVNEYEPGRLGEKTAKGQGIAMHTDHRDFGPTIATISLGDAWAMDFEEPRTGRKCEMMLEVGSALTLSRSARFRWQHGIAGRKTEVDGRGRRPRKRRVSLTFRTVPAPTH